MTIITSSALVLADVADGFPLTHPVIGWHTIVTATNIVADTSEANYPASNLANPATHLEWRAANTSQQYITITTNYADDIDYVAIAKHNLSSAGIPVSIEILDTGVSPNVWIEVVEDSILDSDGPAIFRFEARTVSEIRIRFQSGSEAARAAVVYCGKLLVIERRIYASHMSMTDGIKSSVANGRSENGNFLGRIVLGQWKETTVALSLITPAWFRTYMRPFLVDGRNDPFFFAWRPQIYPGEVGFGALSDDPEPTPAAPSNLLSMDLKVNGIT